METMAKKALIISVFFYSALLAFTGTVSAHEKREGGNGNNNESGNQRGSLPSDGLKNICSCNYLSDKYGIGNINEGCFRGDHSGPWLYYQNGNDENRIYRCNLNRSNFA
ncbi:hypothetical protein G9A89_008250 [Geosiphon pyriformis]|nr:hypothetical protein G9A89_008250 [Geosiphon pyriformis]